MRLPPPVRSHGARRTGAALGTVCLVLLVFGCGGDSAEHPTPAPPRADHATPTTPSLLPAGTDSDLARIADATGGRLGLAVAPLGGGPLEVAGELRTATAWSTMKVPLLVTLVASAGGWDALSAQERDQAALAITRSDNEAALALFDRLEELEGGLVPASEAIDEVLRDAGDPETQVNTEPNAQGFSTFGQTAWSADASATFTRALAAGCLLGAANTPEVLALMGEVVADQRWGLGEAGYPASTSLAFKGGWGPEPGGGYLVRQIGAVGDQRAGLVVSIIATAPGAGSAAFAAGREMVTRTARWVRTAIGTPRQPTPHAPACSRG
jgi:hypothetical protein